VSSNYVMRMLGKRGFRVVAVCGFGADVVLYVGKRVDCCGVVSVELFLAAINKCEIQICRVGSRKESLKFEFRRS
jgi:hypothetical protein